MQTVLTPVQNLSRFEADESAEEFISWIMQQLQQVSELVDTGQRYTNLDNEINFYFAMCEHFGIEHNKSSGKQPQCDGQTENANGVLEDTLRHFVNDSQTPILIRCYPWQSSP